MVPILESRSQIVMVDNEQSFELTNLQSVEFDKAFERLHELVDFREANELHPKRSNAVYTSCVVLWMLIYQRLKPDASLESAVKHLIETQPDYLPENKRLREGKLSKSTAAYSQARSDLPLEVIQWFSREVSQAIVAESKVLLDGRSIFLFDGTTIALAPEKELQTAFPPASNQFGEGVWPIALLTVFHELGSGCALLPEIGAMYGDSAVSETELGRNGMAKLPANSIVMTDAGFGIFGVGYEARRYGHDFLLRMKKSNFESLRKKATLQSESINHKTYSLKWTPTPKNRKTQPELPKDASIDVLLHEVQVTEQLTLYLVTSLEHDANTLAELFKHRVQVEFDIRNLKVVLDTENIRAKSVDMFKKELYTSVVAYNLVGQLRRQAAEINNVPPRRMSFKGTWTTFQTFLLRHMHTDPQQWRAAFRKALYYATKDKLPNRPGRKAKREAYRKRSKDQQFQKREKPPSKLNQNDLK
jgi:hypothetical protein